MAGKSKTPVKSKAVSKPKNKPMTSGEKLSDTKSRIGRIVEGNDPGYHVR